MSQEEVWRDREERAYHHGAENLTVLLECYALNVRLRLDVLDVRIVGRWC